MLVQYATVSETSSRLLGPSRLRYRWGNHLSTKFNVHASAAINIPLLEIKFAGVSSSLSIYIERRSFEVVVGHLFPILVHRSFTVAFNGRSCLGHVSPFVTLGCFFFSSTPPWPRSAVLSPTSHSLQILVKTRLTATSCTRRS